MRKVGEDISEVLDYIPGRFEVIRHIRSALSTVAGSRSAPVIVKLLDPDARGLHQDLGQCRYSLHRSAGLSPSSLLVSNNKFICRPEAGAGTLRCFVAILPDDTIVAPGACGVARAREQQHQINQRREIRPWGAYRHAGANHWIDHRTGNRNHDACWTENLK